MHNVSANYTLPTILDTLQPPRVNPPQIKGTVKGRDTTPTGGTTGTGSSSDSSQTSATSIQTTFLSLLSQELQNQDPTDPVDSTAMVGQMISLNQLDQLININQTLSGVSSTTAAGSLAPAPGSAKQAAGDTTAAATTAPAPNTLPFDPSTMMPISSAGSSAMAASINSSLNPASMGFASTNNNTAGDK